MAVVDPTKKEQLRKLFPELNERDLDFLIALSLMNIEHLKRSHEKVRPVT
ncbi:hypothetical protein [Lelliottia nimipressuralis]|jgi:hypothetical protein|nr:hypothetical protein [Lelliottia nimipressuralis]